MEVQKLLPCPFCGEPAMAFEEDKYDDGGQYLPWFSEAECAGCMNCGIYLLVEDWQKRTVV